MASLQYVALPLRHIVSPAMASTTIITRRPNRIAPMIGSDKENATPRDLAPSSRRGGSPFQRQRQPSSPSIARRSAQVPLALPTGEVASTRSRRKQHPSRRQSQPARAFVQSGFNEVRFRAHTKIAPQTSQKPLDSISCHRYPCHRYPSVVTPHVTYKICAALAKSRY